MQRGGFDLIPIKDSDFKYTEDADRIQWNKNVFPIAEYLIQAIQNIPWSTYSFQKTSRFWKRSGATFTSEEFAVSTAPITSPLYYYFGGSVYEIMNKLFTRPGKPTLRNYVDPTGDLDVHLILPNLIFPEGKSVSNYYPYFFQQLPYQPRTRRRRRSIWRAVNSGNGGANSNNNNTTNNRQENVPNAEPPEIHGCGNNVFTGENATRLTTKRDPRRYTALVEDFTDWIMEHFAENLRKYKRGGLFELLFGNTVKFNLDNDSEGRYADKIICLGNIKLVRSYLPYMNLIKIQLIGKFKGMTRSDHICEFLLEVPNSPSTMTLDKYFQLKHNYHTLKGFPMSNFGELVRGNLDSLINRYSLLFKPETRHKFYNHVGRMQYLHDFFKDNLNAYYEKDATKLKLTKERYMDLGNNLSKFSFYIAENFFSTKLFYFDYKRRFREDMSPTEMSDLRNLLLQGLIGSYPKFLFHKSTKVPHKYISPFTNIEFDLGDRIPARTVFTLTHIFDVADRFPQEVLDMMGRVGDEINVVQLYRILRILNVVTF